VASGDGGADTLDTFALAAVSGINVGAYSSTPYNVAVGGTDFADSYFGTNSTYWSATNGPYYSSALSYVPEIPWNDSCASQLAAQYLGFPAPYGPNGFCNSPLGEAPGTGMGVVAGSGGPSGCAYGNPAIPGVVGGSCRGYRKPLYQYLVYGNPRDGVRDLPDVSLFASDGFWGFFYYSYGVWGHYYVVCYSNLSATYVAGRPCVGDPSNWTGSGGTSFSAPIMAGIQAMINQTTEKYQGNPNFVYYLLAAFEYGFKGNSSCDSTLGNKVDPHCVFYDVTLGDIDVNCLPLVDSNGNTIGSFNCYYDGGINGVLSTSNSSYKPAYPATKGYDYATGLGSVNAYNLARSWPGSRLRDKK